MNAPSIGFIHEVNDFFVSVLVGTEIWDRTRGNGHHLKFRRFTLNVGKHFFTVSVTKHWHKLSKEVVDSPSLEISKIHLDMVLGNGLQVAFLEQDSWTR